MNTAIIKKELVSLRERVDNILGLLEQETKPAPVKRIAQKGDRKDKYRTRVIGGVHGNAKKMAV
jgi:hypothetical protein